MTTQDVVIAIVASFIWGVISALWLKSCVDMRRWVDGVSGIILWLTVTVLCGLLAVRLLVSG